VRKHRQRPGTAIKNPTAIRLRDDRLRQPAEADVESARDGDGTPRIIPANVHAAMTAKGIARPARRSRRARRPKPADTMDDR
jgi:hypothetical protein